MCLSHRLSCPCGALANIWLTYCPGQDQGNGKSSTRTAQRNSNPSPTHIHPWGLHCGNDLGRSPQPPVVASFPRSSPCSHNKTIFTTHRHPALAQSPSAGRQMYGMKRRPTLRHAMRCITGCTYRLPRTPYPSSARSLVYIHYCLRTSSTSRVS